MGGAPWGSCSTEARAIMEADPTVLAGLNRYEITPMHVGAARGL